MTKAKQFFESWHKALNSILLTMIFSLIGYIYISGTSRIDKAIDSINIYHIVHEKNENKQNKILTEHEVRLNYIENRNHKPSGKN